MDRLSSLIRLDKEFSASYETLLTQLKSNEPKPCAVSGLCVGAIRDFIAEISVSLASDTGKCSLIVAPDERESERIAALLSSLSLRVAVFKPRNLVFYNISASHDCERERLLVLHKLISGELDFVVTTADALSSYTIPKEELESHFLSLRIGDEISPTTLCERLVESGYARVELVESAGQFAMRGGIVDFFSGDSAEAVRIEFFGDEVDRISAFNPLTQRAVGALDTAVLSPAYEVIITEERKATVLAEIKRLMDKAKDETMKGSLALEYASLADRGYLLTRDKYLDIIYPRRETLLSYFSSLGSSAVLIFGTAEGEERRKRISDGVSEEVKTLYQRGLIGKKDAEYYLSSAEYKAALSSSAVMHINPFSSASGGELSGLFGFRTRRTVGYGENNYSLLLEDLRGYLKNSYRVLIKTPNKQGALSLCDSLREEGIETIFVPTESFICEMLSTGTVTVTVGHGEGYDLISARAALLSTERDEGARIMAERRHRRILRKYSGAGASIMSHNDLSVGDYVVHASYGIGLFEGIQSVRVDGVTKDYITIRYAGTDKLFLPCDRLELISRYIGERAQDGSVKLSKMGGTEWHRTKAKAKGAAQDIAKKLIKLYAERQNAKGFAFPEDSELEEEFAASFEFEETDSQRQAIEEIKRDMMKPVPMNRLLLGDVGFGKTEVALRAAFKAIMGGKQVAILVPTTILALQHYTTAISRMRGYAVRVEMLSRFRTPKEQAKILADTKRGKVDILIGTHKLLSRSVEFLRLGLLVVDEEQRFGVAQKEKLKEMSVGVDVLTLSATPIPRTLNMAINGIADMSVLDEAPGDRRPVQTYVLEHDEPVVFDAIRRELARGGQVLYLYNNTATIPFAASAIIREIPEARVAYAHGQMERDELEDIWQMMVRGEIDVLVCTTIIETGVDLPNANTLIIENADRMGLSQLHQIRGRVGRSERQAYAYFTYRPGKSLSEIATKRLSAIREYAEFGAGFKVALRDLEIRGAGNLLGAEQHGYIDSVGYDLYVKLLGEAVDELKGESRPAEFEATVDIKADAHIPERYISSASARLEMYKRISDIRTPEDKMDVYDELTDRFGEPPRATQRLLSVALVRSVMELARISRVTLNGGKLEFFTEKLDMEILGELFAKYKGRLYGSSVGGAALIMRLSAGEDAISALEELLCEYYRIKNQGD